MNFCFFGTLRDDDVLAAVLGRTVLRRPRHAAWLAGYRCVTFRGATFPALVAHADGKVPGLLVRGLTRLDAAVLDRFEGAAYRRRQLSVELADGKREGAFVYLLRRSSSASEVDWDLEHWRKHHKQAFLDAVQHMKRHGAAG